jgi:hypothetical protein
LLIKVEKKREKNYLLAAAFIYCALAVDHRFFMMSSSSGTISVSRCPVIFDGVNYNHWA